MEIGVDDQDHLAIMHAYQIRPASALIRQWESSTAKAKPSTVHFLDAVRGAAVALLLAASHQIVELRVLSDELDFARELVKQSHV